MRLHGVQEGAPACTGSTRSPRPSGCGSTPLNCESCLTGLTAAITAGGEMKALVQAVKDRESERERLERQLARASSRAAFDLNRPGVEAHLRDKLADWRGLLDRRVPQARQILRKLLPGKSLMFEAKDGYYEFWADASVEKLLESVLPRTVASATRETPFHMDGSVLWRAA